MIMPDHVMYSRCMIRTSCTRVFTWTAAAEVYITSLRQPTNSARRGGCDIDILHKVVSRVGRFVWALQRAHTHLYSIYGGP